MIRINQYRQLPGRTLTQERLGERWTFKRFWPFLFSFFISLDTNQRTNKQDTSASNAFFKIQQQKKSVLYRIRKNLISLPLPQVVGVMVHRLYMPNCHIHCNSTIVSHFPLILNICQSPSNFILVVIVNIFIELIFLSIHLSS